MSRTRIIILIVGLFALLVALLGYSGAYNALTRDPYHDLKQETWAVIDQAQLWFNRSKAYDGGSKSFIGLDFKKLKLSDKAGSITFQGEHAKFEISNLRRDSFDLIVSASDETEFVVKQIRFDSIPELVLSTKSK
ncbi:hypothetical protein K9N50_10615 [bacterium]|nr:hypothetical protein [bacterium]